MIQNIEILNLALDELDEINNKSFSFEKFNEVNDRINKLLVEIKSNELNDNKDNRSEDYINIVYNLLNKIEKLETKILPKANLLDSFSKSNP